MGPQNLESELNKDPFQPFRIVTTSFDRYEVFSLIQIIRLEPLPTVQQQRSA